MLGAVGRGGTSGPQEEKADLRKERGFFVMFWRKKDMVGVGRGGRGAELYLGYAIGEKNPFSSRTLLIKPEMSR